MAFRFGLRDTALPVSIGLFGPVRHRRRGEVEVEAILEIFRAEVVRAMVLVGCPDVAALDRSWLIPADSR